MTASGSQTGAPRFTVSALFEPVDIARVREYESRTGLNSTVGRVPWYGAVVGVALCAFAAFIIALPIAFVLMVTGFPADEPFAVAYLVAVVIVAVIAWYVRKASRLSGIARYRVGRFAAENGFEFVPFLDDPESRGLIFELGTDRRASEIVRLSLPRPVEIANYRYVEKTSKTHVTHQWSYVEFRLDRPLPHVVLDGVANNSKLLGSNLPAKLAGAQRLSLEGDFDRHFTLYCPEGYETDALYLFTPDVMARFIDAGADLDVEIVDDRLYVYASGSRQFSSADPEMWEWVFATVDALNAKLTRWERWRDERLAAAGSGGGASAGPGAGAGAAAAASAVAPFGATPSLGTIPRGVAPEGRRLKQRIPLLAFVPLVFMVGIWFFIPLLESLTSRG